MSGFTQIRLYYEVTCCYTDSIPECNSLADRRGDIIAGNTQVASHLLPVNAIQRDRVSNIIRIITEIIHVNLMLNFNTGILPDFTSNSVKSKLVNFPFYLFRSKRLLSSILPVQKQRTTILHFTCLKTKVHYPSFFLFENKGPLSSILPCLKTKVQLSSILPVQK